MPFFAKTCDYSKLKANLRLCRERIGLLQKKKTELGVKARREIAELLKQGKIERSRIRTEQIVREDYVVEVMEILQTYADLLLTRFGIFETSREVEISLEKAIATLIWCTPRLEAEVKELKDITLQFTAKYSKEYVDTCKQNRLKNVDSVVMKQLDYAAPPPALVEMYMTEIARTYDVLYEPNLELLSKGGGSGSGGGGGGGGNGGTLAPGSRSETHEELINFDPFGSIPGGFPSLPEGYDGVQGPWNAGPMPGPAGVPYPDISPFPSAEGAPPPIPTIPPSGTMAYPNQPESNPPSYDTATLPRDEKQAPPSLPSAPDVGAPPPGEFTLPDPQPDPQADPSTQPNDDDMDFEALNRRFNQLTNRP